MPITQDQVKHIAKLARLGLKNKEIKKMQNDLAVILDYIELLNGVDVGKVNRTAQAAPLSGIDDLRQDKAQPEKPEVVEAMLNQAPAKQDRYIKVKQVL